MCVCVFHRVAGRGEEHEPACVNEEENRKDVNACESSEKKNLISLVTMQGRHTDRLAG